MIRDTCRFNLTSPQDTSEHFVESHYHKNLKFENFGESELQIASLCMTDDDLGRDQD